jgi:hypothetical protein
MAATVNLVLDQGSTWSQPIAWKTGTPAVAVDLTGYSARAQVRSSASSATTLLSLTDSNGGIAITTSTGTMTLSATAAQTAAIPAGRYVYDLEAVSGGGIVTRICEGTLTVTPEVTR